MSFFVVLNTMLVFFCRWWDQNTFTPWPDTIGTKLWNGPFLKMNKWDLSALRARLFGTLT
jgi:hypothetical protein